MLVYILINTFLVAIGYTLTVFVPAPIRAKESLRKFAFLCIQISLILSRPFGMWKNEGNVDLTRKLGKIKDTINGLSDCGFKEQ